jgi:hypothetical protein
MTPPCGHWLARHDGRSGFAPLPRGTYALGARLRLIDGAERRIDLQSCIIKPDLSSRLIAARIVAAANLRRRGGKPGDRRSACGPARAGVGANGFSSTRSTRT